jgi:hypothetical protein
MSMALSGRGDKLPGPDKDESEDDPFDSTGLVRPEYLQKVGCDLSRS